MRLTLEDISNALGSPGRFASDCARAFAFTGISTDTRSLQPGDLYIALTGPNTDGHQYVPQALRAGAAGLVVSQQTVASRDTPVFRVPDTEVAYGLLARYWRDWFEIPVIGVTGSVGKTTTKEMLAAALSPLGPVLKTEASQNNETGVPKALLQLTPDHRAAVVEMGMRGWHQIEYLCGIARPTAGVLTLIGDNHIAMLGSRDAIADAKGELLESLPADGVAILSADDPYLPRLRAKTKARVVTFGMREEADYCAAEITRSACGWQFTVRDVRVEIASPSRHDIANALAALAAAENVGAPLAEAARALSSYAPPPMRMQIAQTAWGGVVLNDTYNAAPDSVRSALETLRDFAGARKIAFLGDMRELGEQSVPAHRELGDVIAALGGLDELYTVGDLAAQIPGAQRRFSDSEEAARFAARDFAPEPGDVILIKGSRAVAMEKIVEALTSRGMEAHGN